jgi:hypothetical protein
MCPPANNPSAGGALGSADVVGVYGLFLDEPYVHGGRRSQWLRRHTNPTVPSTNTRSSLAVSVTGKPGLF